uniref:Collagen-like protein n=1 Tax=virus sp. ct5rm7 TaxID=2827298 RepID=A0A8S5RH31_9VIRU|nr:MAG TPA: hypothetical protein [virus sp. ct5rm7]
MEKVVRIALGLALSLMTLSCSDEMHMLFPEGPQGPQGLSAYEVWVKAVENGEVDWPKDRTDVNNFFIFLKGKDGKDGVDGVDGINGLSAYEIWKQEVEKGLDNPHNPGTQWDKNKTSLQDFWYYLSGADGQDGATPKIGENGNWWINGEDTGIPARGKDGANGQDGKDGKDAVAPTVEIGANGNWHINGEDTGVPARGKDGQNGQDGRDGHTPTVTIGENGNWFVDGVDTGHKAQGPKGDKGEDGENGKDGKTPIVTIGQNGNWYIDGVDTGKPSRGKDGDNGLSVTVKIGDNGNWFIDDIDTGVPARGSDGRNGTQWSIGENGNWYYFDYETNTWKDSGKPSQGADGTGSAGLSAYELWVREVLKGTISKDGIVWDKNKISMSDFWEYLRGNNGKDGTDGKDGEDLSGVPQPVVQQGIYNVIAGYYNISHHEYVNWGTGGVTYTVYGPNAQHVPAGVKITNMPKMDSNLEFVTDENGQFVVSKEQLPQNSYNSIEIYGKPTVTVDGETKEVATATHVPCAMQIRLVVKDVLFNETQAPYKFSTTAIFLQLERKKDAGSTWEEVPTWIGATRGMSYVKIYDSNHQLVGSEPTQEYRTSNVLTNYRFNVTRRIKSDSHYDYSQDAAREAIGWYGEGDERYYMKVSVGSLEDSKICYGETPEADAWIEDVPLRPAPYCTRLDLSYEIDNRNMLVKAYFDQTAMQNIIDKTTVLYEAKFSNRYINGSNTWIPTRFEDPSSRANMQLISERTSGVGSITTSRSQFHSIPQLLPNGNPGYIAMEHVLSGSKLQICANGLFSVTFFSFDIGIIHVEGTGSDAKFTLEKNPALKDDITVTNIK